MKMNKKKLKPNKSSKMNKMLERESVIRDFKVGTFSNRAEKASFKLEKTAKLYSTEGKNNSLKVKDEVEGIIARTFGQNRKTKRHSTKEERNIKAKLNAKSVDDVETEYYTNFCVKY